MSTVKKAYVAIITMLQNCADGTLVSDILPEAIELASAKSGGGGGKPTQFHKDESGVVVGIKCYYHKLWMSPEAVEFGKKASSNTGFNNMCKDGANKWNKQQRDAAKARDEALTLVAAGEIDTDGLQDLLAEIEETKDAIVPREDGYGFETLEELLESLEA